MKKKTYQQPRLHIVRIHQAQMLCASRVNTVSSNLKGDDAIDFDGGGSGPARGRSSSDWDE
ncbi:MAG: hypothetical protein II826_03815 [Prevotella sp.]|nr:hypothetical protein [Prevotella sp.]